MFGTRLLLLLATALLALSAVSQANQAEVQPQADATAETPPLAVTPDFFNPNSGLDNFTGAQAPIGAGLKFNAAHPAGWIKWVDPKSHMSMHKSFMNPATYAQFMQPRFYLEFMKPENMAAWMDFNQYQVMMAPQTMNHWMNPGSYIHVMNPDMYAAALNPANYMVYLNPATYADWTGSQTCDQNDPNRTPGWFGYSC